MLCVFVRVCVCLRVPNEAVKQEDGAAYDAGGARLLMLGAGEGQPVVHVTLMVHDGLKQSGQNRLSAAWDLKHISKKVANELPVWPETACQFNETNRSQIQQRNLEYEQRS